MEGLGGNSTPAASGGNRFFIREKEMSGFNKDTDGIVLKPLLPEDIPLFEKWLCKEYIYRWLCPDGEEQKESWLEEVKNPDGKYDFIEHFIVYYHDRKIGYGLCADCYFLKDHREEGHDFEELYGDVCEMNHTFEIGYLIGEEAFLGKGIGKSIIRKREEKIRERGGREISADPDEANMASVKALLSNGFQKKKDGDYRKTLGGQGIPAGKNAL